MRLSVKVPEPHLSTLTQVIGDLGMSLSARDISTSLHSLAALGARPEQAALDCVGYRAHLLLQAQLGHPVPTLHEAAAATGGEAVAAAAGGPAEAHEGASTSSTPPSSASRGSAAAAPYRSGPSSASTAAAAADLVFSPQSISMMVHSAALLGYFNSQLLSSVAEIVVRDIDEFAPQGVSNMVWSMAKLDHYEPTLLKAALAYFRQRHAEFKPQEIANLMWALTRLR